MKGPETRLRLKIQKGLQSEYPGSYWRKIHGNQFQNRGIPDLLGSVLGVFIALEIKRPRGKGATAIQKFEIHQIRKSYGYAWVVRDLKTALKAVELALKGTEERWHGTRPIMMFQK